MSDNESTGATPPTTRSETATNEAATNDDYGPCPKHPDYTVTWEGCLVCNNEKQERAADANELYLRREAMRERVNLVTDEDVVAECDGYGVSVGDCPDGEHRWGYQGYPCEHTTARDFAIEIVSQLDKMEVEFEYDEDSVYKDSLAEKIDTCGDIDSWSQSWHGEPHTEFSRFKVLVSKTGYKVCCRSCAESESRASGDRPTEGGPT